MGGISFFSGVRDSRFQEKFGKFHKIKSNFQNSKNSFFYGSGGYVGEFNLVKNTIFFPVFHQTDLTPSELRSHVNTVGKLENAKKR